MNKESILRLWVVLFCAFSFQANAKEQKSVVTNALKSESQSSVSVDELCRMFKKIGGCVIVDGNTPSIFEIQIDKTPLTNSGETSVGEFNVGIDDMVCLVSPTNENLRSGILDHQLKSIHIHNRAIGNALQAIGDLIGAKIFLLERKPQQFPQRINLDNKIMKLRDALLSIAKQIGASGIFLSQNKVGEDGGIRSITIAFH